MDLMKGFDWVFHWEIMLVIGLLDSVHFNL